MTLLGHMVPGAFVGDITFNSCTINPAFVLDLIESLWAHAAKATVVSNNKPNTIWHLTLEYMGPGLATVRDGWNACVLTRLLPCSKSNSSLTAHCRSCTYERNI